MTYTGLIRIKRVSGGFEVSVGDYTWSIDVLNGISLIGSEGCVEGVVKIVYKEVVEGYDPAKRRWRVRTVREALIKGNPARC
jgi:hypothetical protein